MWLAGPVHIRKELEPFMRWLEEIWTFHCRTRIQGRPRASTAPGTGARRQVVTVPYDRTTYHRLHHVKRITFCEDTRGENTTHSSPSTEPSAAVTDQIWRREESIDLLCDLHHQLHHHKTLHGDRGRFILVRLGFITLFILGFVLVWSLLTVACYGNFEMNYV